MLHACQPFSSLCQRNHSSCLETSCPVPSPFRYPFPVIPISFSSDYVNSRLKWARAQETKVSPLFCDMRYNLLGTNSTSGILQMGRRIVGESYSRRACVLHATFDRPSIKRSVVAGLGVGGGVEAAPAAIEVRRLSLSVNGDKGEVVVLKDCSLRIPQGQLWMLLGPNGCGKSTLLKALAGLLRPNRGRMYVGGPRSFVFQNPDHQVVMPTAAADVAFGLGRFDLPEDEVTTRVVNSLGAVGMSEYAQRPIQTLSGGQKQRVAIAGALAEASRVLLLDELTTFLDESDQTGVLEAVRKVVGEAQGVTALWVTHRLEELEYADGAIYMENGRIILSGTADDVKGYIKTQQEEISSNGAIRQ